MSFLMTWLSCYSFELDTVFQGRKKVFSFGICLKKNHWIDPINLCICATTLHLVELVLPYCGTLRFSNKCYTEEPFVT